MISGGCPDDGAVEKMKGKNKRKNTKQAPGKPPE
jgi:hypothetical protein